MSEADPTPAEEPRGEPAAPPAPAFRDVPWRLRHVVVALVPLTVVVALALTPTARALPLPVRAAAVLAVEVWMLGYPLALAWRHGWRPRVSISPTRAVSEVLLAGLVLAALWAVLALGYVSWTAAFGEPPRQPDPLGRGSRSDSPFVLLLVIAMLVGAPVSEEVCFRGMAYSALKRSTAKVLAVSIQAVAFGALHLGYGPVHAVGAGVAGVALALVYDARKTLVTPVLCHMMHNSAVLALMAVAAFWAADAPALGVHGTPHESGMLVTSVTPNGGAEAAGIRPGDVLYTVDGWGVRTREDVMNTVHDKQPGESVPVEYIRDGLLHRVDVVLKSRRELNR